MGKRLRRHRVSWNATIVRENTGLHTTGKMKSSVTTCTRIVEKIKECVVNVRKKLTASFTIQIAFLKFGFDDGNSNINYTGNVTMII